MRPDLILASWIRTRRAMAMDGPALARRRERLWRALQPALAKTPALAAYHGLPLSEYHVTDTRELRADYGLWNSLGETDAGLRALADAAEMGEAQTGDISAGWSSGSSAQGAEGAQRANFARTGRGLFVASAAERADYLGQSLARLLPPRALLRRQRIALHLRADNALYSDVGGRRIAFSHFPLSPPVTDTIQALEAFQPTILIAPPHRLLRFAELGLKLPELRHLFCGSEPISAAESAHIAGIFGIRPRAIFQATEGFIGAQCSEGHLHLNDHSLTIELEEVPGTSGFRPIITDLRRVSQPVVRVRGDDFLEAETANCPCGYAGRVIRPPQGRVSDIWHSAGRTITPPQIVTALEDAIGGAVPWQAIAGPSSVELGVQFGVQLRLRPAVCNAVKEAGRQALSDLTGMPVEIKTDLTDWPAPKRRKVVWTGG